jgi:hypothetical protein
MAKRKPAAAKRKTVRTKDPFVKVPLWWAAEVAKATKSPGVMVWVRLLYLAWDNGMRPVPLANVKLKNCGVSRKIKNRVLRDLERAGLITVERRFGKSPVVTLVLR